MKRYKDLKYHLFQKRDNLTSEHINQAKKSVAEVTKSWKELKLNVTPKTHWVFTHGIETLEREFRTLGYYAEQFAETLHQYFEDTTSCYNDSTTDPLTGLQTRKNRRVRELEAFNCLRHDIPQPKKTRAKRKLTGAPKQESSESDSSDGEPTNKRNCPDTS